MSAFEKIFLLGLPGSGKTSLGKDLARSLKVQFVDLDSEIELFSGKSIRGIFSGEGETRFREIESTVLKKWCSVVEPFVMATGGGTPCFFDNLKTINEAGTSVFLDVPVEEIVRRMEKTPLAERPLLADNKELLQKIERLHADRIKYYNGASITVSGAQLTASDIVKAKAR